MLYQSSSDFTFTNAGTFETLGATIQPDYLRADIVNNSGATITIDGVATKEDGGSGATSITNGGTLSVGDGDNLAISGSSTFSQSSGGTFSPTVDATTGVWGITGGTDSIAGTLDVNTVGLPAVGNTYNVIGSATLVSGTFCDGRGLVQRHVHHDRRDREGDLSGRSSTASRTTPIDCWGLPVRDAQPYRHW